MKIGGPFLDKQRRKSVKKWYLSYFVPRLEKDGRPVLVEGKAVLERKRPYYETKDAAQADKPRILAQYGAAGAAAAGGVLSGDQAREYEQARAIVAEVSLVEVARFYRLHHPLGEAKKVGELVTLMLDTLLARLGKKNRHYQDLKSRLPMFAVRFGDRIPETLTRSELMAYLLGLGKSGRTVLNHKRAVVNFLNWLRELEPPQITINPIAGLKKRHLPKADNKEIEFFTLEETRAYLRACERFDPEIVAHEVIQLFSGVRSDDEMEDFDGKWVLPATREVVIPSEIAKTGRREVIDNLEDNFWLWWGKYGRAGLLRPKNYKKRHRRIRVLASLAGDPVEVARVAALKINQVPGVESKKGVPSPLPSWPWNARRRTFCTYHVAKHQSAALTALILRHRGEPSTLHNSYRGTGVTQAQGVEYFAIIPEK